MTAASFCRLSGRFGDNLDSADSIGLADFPNVRGAIVYHAGLLASRAAPGTARTRPIVREDGVSTENGRSLDFERAEGHGGILTQEARTVPEFSLRPAKL